MSGPQNEPSDDIVARAIAATRQLPLPDGPSAAIASQTVAALREAASHPNTNFLQRIYHMPWTSKVTAALATAASLLVVYLGLSGFTGSALAFADVVEVLNKVRSATWKTTSEVKLPHNQTAKSSGVGMFLAPSHERTEFIFMGSKGISIVDGEKGEILTLDPASKKAVIIDVKNVPPGHDSPFGKTFQGLRELAADAQKDKAGKVQRLGDETIDGRRAEGFRIQLGSVDVKIWADPETLLPMRVEYSSITGPESRSVMTDFQVDVDLDESLFSIEVPKDYTVQQTAQIDLSKNPIYYLIETLKLTAELNNGVFPPTLRGDEGIDGILSQPNKLAEMLAKKVGKGSPEEIKKLAIELSMNAGATFGMLAALSTEQNDWHYAGKDVKLNTPDRPIFWYRAHKESKTYHVLYADLTVKEVPSEEAPKAPQDEPKAP